MSLHKGAADERGMMSRGWDTLGGGVSAAAQWATGMDMTSDNITEDMNRELTPGAIQKGMADYSKALFGSPQQTYDRVKEMGKTVMDGGDLATVTGKYAPQLEGDGKPLGDAVTKNIGNGLADATLSSTQMGMIPGTIGNIARGNFGNIATHAGNKMNSLFKSSAADNLPTTGDTPPMPEPAAQAATGEALTKNFPGSTAAQQAGENLNSVIQPGATSGINNSNLGSGGKAFAHIMMGNWDQGLSALGQLGSKPNGQPT